MSGHSKWAKIKHAKGAADAKRGAIFSRLSKEITIIVRKAGGDPDMNPSLRTVLQKCKQANMPADNIQRAIKKGTGEIEGAALEEVIYEGYAGGGVGIVVQALTDNKNRAAAEIRHAFTKHGSNFAAQGAVTRGFDRKGQIFVDASVIEEDKLMGIVIEAGADDLKREDDQFEILTDPTSFDAVTKALEEAKVATLSAEVALVPQTYVPVKDKSTAATLVKLVDALEENEDVQNVYTNMDIDDAIMKELEKA